MKKSESLAWIIDLLSADNGDTLEEICNNIQTNGYCSGVSCDDCPFNLVENTVIAASELNELITKNNGE